MNKRSAQRKTNKMYSIEKLMLFLLPVPLVFLFTGTNGIIRQANPFEMTDFSSTLSAISNHFGMHFLILSGALCFTLMFWFATRKFWR